ncbi:MAG: glycosyltransferase family 4 protein [Acidimicrobiales bacterium]
MTRILVLSNMYPPHHLGGYELSCRDVVDRWRSAAHEVTVLTSTMTVPGVGDGDPEHVHRELDIFLRDGELWSPSLPRRRRVEEGNEGTLRRHLDRGFDVVSIWHMGAMSAGLLGLLVASGVPLVFVVCDDWPTYAVKLDPWMRLWRGRPRLGRVVARLSSLQTSVPDLDRAGTFLFVSDNTRQRCMEMSPWSFPDSTVTYSGIDHADFPVSAAAPVRPWRGRLLTVGRLDHRKGFETALRALPLLPGATLEVLYSAPGSYLATLEALSHDLGVADRVSYGVAERSNLRERYEEADVFLFPSEWDEPFGLVPVEAMACATPVVATARGGSAEFLVDERNCLKMESGDPASLASAVRRLANDEALRSRLITGGLDTATALSVDSLADTLERWHLAAAHRFESGRPEHRRILSSGVR